MPRPRNFSQNLQSFIGSLERIDFSNKQFFVKNINYLLFISMLAALYIANARLAERRIREIERYRTNIQVLRWEYRTLQATLMAAGKQTSVSQSVAGLGLRDLTKPPPKLQLKQDSR